MNRRLTAVLAAVLLLTTAVAPATAATPDDASGTKLFTRGGTYIVQLAEWPAVAYDGSIKGYRATRPDPGSKIDPNATEVTKYVGFLKARHDELLKSVGATRKLYDYTYSFNGFAAKLTAAQANKLAVAKGVVAVTPDELRSVDTSSTPAFLGLTPGGSGDLWDLLGGVDSAGDGIIIGIVDSGIWPESKSFSDRNAKGKLVYGPVPGFHGKCASAETSEAWDANLCNRKLVAAQYFNESWGGNAGIEAERPWEFTSPRDYNGHGTHTASTSGGNAGVPTTGPAAAFGAISGIAPHARIAAYKALWSTEDASTASGFTGDLVAAIDQAVADGVDVINYSISGTLTSYTDPAEISFLFAAASGIFVSESAGNSGPASSTVAHPGPWTTTVAAGTHNRDGQGSITLGSGATYNGASVATAVGPAPLVDSVNAGLAGESATDVELCVPGTLDPAVVTGKIVICKRGVIARVDKSRAVLEAGGLGMVLYNSPDSSLNADFHFVPSVHVSEASGLAIKAYANGGGSPTATINNATIITTAPAPFTASFSSRGPSLAGGGDVLKPDVIAPGQDILAAVAPPGNAGRDFNLYSGTSMSAPHVAGLAALLMDLHPTWSPMAVKSALMTSAYDVLDPVSTTTRIFRQGAGHVAPNSAADPGLVFDAGLIDWRGFLRSQGLCTFCFGSSPAPVFDPSDYNSASISIGALAGIQTVTRRVTNVGGSAATYTPSVTGMSGITTVVSPATLNIAAGATATFTVQFTTAGATLNAYTGGQLTWTDGTHNVRIPLVVKPVALAAPAEVSGTGANINYGVTFGYSGAFSADPRGLVPATVTPGVVPQDPDQTFNPADPTGTIAIPVTIPAGSTFARFQLFDADVDPGSDIDLYVYKGATLVGASGGGTSDEVVSLVSPAAGADYVVYVHGWGVADGISTPFALYHWVLGTTDAGNMTVTEPASAVIGTSGTVTLSFSGLAGATKYLGSVVYTGATGMPNPTIVRINTP